ncbi:MAG: PEP-CTERM sorting domain-containing protein [Opitutales bacterium]|nr:PEP-CTERM sorting domain-containing protein [Opitutales bacterium]
MIERLFVGGFFAFGEPVGLTSILVSNPSLMKKFLLLSSLAATACLAVSVSAQQSFNFNPPDFSTGSIVGQNGWFGNANATEKAQIVSNPSDPFNDQWLALEGSATSKMNAFVSVPSIGTPPAISFDAWMEPESAAADPAELFMRFNGWDNFLSIKATLGEIEIRENPSTNVSLTGVTIPFNEWFNFRMEYSVVGGFAQSAEFFVNNVSIGMISGLDNIAIGAGTNFEIRSQNSLSYVNNLQIIPEPSTYAALFGLLAIGLVVVRRRLRK